MARIEPEEDHPLYPYYNKKNKYIVAKHLGRNGLAPQLYWAEDDDSSPLFGLSVTEAIENAEHLEFGTGLSIKDMEDIGVLVAKVHKAPQKMVEIVEKVIKDLWINNKGKCGN